MREQIDLLKKNLKELNLLLENFSVQVKNEEIKKYQLQGFSYGRVIMKLDYNNHRHYLVKQ